MCPGRMQWATTGCAAGCFFACIKPDFPVSDLEEDTLLTLRAVQCECILATLGFWLVSPGRPKLPRTAAKREVISLSTCNPPRISLSDVPMALSRLALWVPSNLLSSPLSRESKYYQHQDLTSSSSWAIAWCICLLPEHLAGSRPYRWLDKCKNSHCLTQLPHL